MKIVLRHLFSASIAVLALSGPSMVAAATGSEGAPQQGVEAGVSAPPNAGVGQPPTDNTKTQAGSQKEGGSSITDSINQIGQGIKGIFRSIFGGGAQEEQQSLNRDSDTRPSESATTDVRRPGTEQGASRRQLARNPKLFQTCERKLAVVTITDSQQMITQETSAYYLFNLPPLSKIASDIGRGLNCFDVLDNDPTLMASSDGVQPDFTIRVRPIAITQSVDTGAVAGRIAANIIGSIVGRGMMDGSGGFGDQLGAQIMGASQSSFGGGTPTKVDSVSVGIEVLCLKQKKVIAEFIGTETPETFQSDKRVIYTWTRKKPNLMQELVGRAYMNAQTDLVSFLSSTENACGESSRAGNIANLADKTVDASTQRSDSNSARLIRALMGKDEKGALILIGKGADVNATDEEYGASALHWAILNGYKEITELLIEKGANINARTKNGATPVYTAASSGQRAILEILIARGADLNAKDEKGVSPLKVASSKGYKGVAELLKAKGARF